MFEIFSCISSDCSVADATFCLFFIENKICISQIILLSTVHVKHVIALK